MTDLTNFIVSNKCWKNYNYPNIKKANCFKKSPSMISGNTVYDIENPYLYALFMLRKKEYFINGKNPKIIESYHVTGQHSIDSILTKNLDWRYSYRKRYGPGVCFSDDLSYALRHSSGRRNPVVMKFLVLVGSTDKRTIDTSSEVSLFHDTVLSNDGNVYVKACEDEFYPLEVYL